MIKRKTKLSISLIVFFGSLLSLLIYISYVYYTNSLSKMKENKVLIKSDDYLSIDSIKKCAISDTVRFYQLSLKNLNEDNENLKSLITQKDIDISLIKKNRDSLVNRLYYYQIKLQNLKEVTDTSKNY